MENGVERPLHDFKEMLDFSIGRQQYTDIATIQQMIPGCIKVEKTDPEMDRDGVDYIAHLRGGAEVLIDGKNRAPGASRYWKGEPEVALEKWSVRPGGKYNAEQAVGWTLNESRDVDYILFTFDPDDCEYVYLFAFQLLRMAFRKYCLIWFEQFPHAVQESQFNGRRWESECVYVPINVAYDAVREVSQAYLNLEAQ